MLDSGKKKKEVNPHKGETLIEKNCSWTPAGEAQTTSKEGKSAELELPTLRPGLCLACYLFGSSLLLAILLLDD